MTIDLFSDSKYKQFIEKLQNFFQQTQGLPLDEMRKLGTEFMLATQKAVESVDRIENIQIPGPDGSDLAIRLYIPQEATLLPTLIYFHGGGWVFGNIEEADPECRRFARHCKCIVASIEYRLCPENPFPKPLQDCYAGAEWLSQNIARFGGDSNQLIIAGESAGGNLAAAVALMARDKKGPKFAAQLLLNPVITSTILDSTYDNCVERHFITKEFMGWCWEQYLQSSKGVESPYISPDRALSHAHLPSALIVTAEYDPLRLEAEKYAEQLRRAHVPVTLTCVPGVIHGFQHIPLYEEAQKITWAKEMGQQLDQLLNKVAF